MKENNSKRFKSCDAMTPLQFGCQGGWHWDDSDKSHQVIVNGCDMQTVHFHPKYSNSTAAVRGTQPLNRCPVRHYWETSTRIFGTSIMFGVATKLARVHSKSFTNIVGEDGHSFGLSHKGLLWHNGQSSHYTREFRENTSTTVGILFDSREGTLTYYKDGVSLGIAFTGLHLIKEDLYPIISSTAAKTQMKLKNIRREYCDLQDICRDTILKSMRSGTSVKSLHLPKTILTYLRADREDGTEYYSLSSATNV